MTLFKQITIIVSALILIMLSTVMVKNFQTANEFIQEQLYTDAQDTATSLGLSLSTVVDKNDITTMETMINTIFDSGYYEEITLIDTDGKTLYARIQPPVVKNVPQWFIELIDFEAPRAQTRINDGWIPFAELYVKSHNGHAYFKLWNTLKDIGGLFVIIGFIALLVIYILLKIVLSSLKKLQKQAEAISSNDFIIQEEMPFTTEIRYVTVVMNKMVSKVKNIFEKEAEAVRQYHGLLYSDTLTGLSNRRYFSLQLNDRLSSESVKSNGTILLVTISGIEKANALIGHQKVDEMIKAFAAILSSHSDPSLDELAARLNGTEFALLLSTAHSDEKHADTIAQKILQETKTCFFSYGVNDETTFITVGLAGFAHNDSQKEILSKADYAVSTASQSGPYKKNDYKKDDLTGSSRGKQEWMDTINEALHHKRIKLALQPVMQNTQTHKVYHREIFMRLEESDGGMHNAGYFMPIINRLGLHSKIDKYVISEAISYLKSGTAETSLAINISAEFIAESSNLEWLAKEFEVLKEKHKNAILYFELSNNDVIHHKNACLALCKTLNNYGHRFGIDKFTGNANDFGYLQEMKPSYVKIDHRYISDMLQNETTGLKNESLNIMIQSLDIKLIATAVETMEEKISLEKIGIEYFQGTAIADMKLAGISRNDR